MNKSQGSASFQLAFLLGRKPEACASFSKLSVSPGWDNVAALS